MGRNVVCVNNRNNVFDVSIKDFFQIATLEMSLEMQKNHLELIINSLLTFKIKAPLCIVIL